MLTQTDKDQKIHHAGLVSVLKQIHDDLDAAVFAAYGWPVDLTDEQILERLVALNAERAAEEARGLVRWLRPEFQSRSLGPRGTSGGEDVESGAEGKRGGRRSRKAGPARQAEPTLTTQDGKRSRRAGPSGPEGPTLPGKRRVDAAAKQPWPKERAERTKAVQEALANLTEPASAAELAKRFARAQKGQVEEILEALVSLGLAHRRRGGKYTKP